MEESIIDKNIKQRLIILAKKYEVASFSDGDPSFILKKYKAASDVEIAAFITAMFSYGKRELFLKKVEYIFNLIDSSSCTPKKWIAKGHWKKDFPSGEKKFYRFHSYDDVRHVFAVFQKILQSEKSFGEYLRKKYLEKFEEQEITNKIDRRLLLSSCISKIFAGCKLVPQSKNSANKRVHMFLRWMVRTNSPVDAGLWKWFSPADLIIPLDVHVLEESIAFGLLPEKCTASLKAALRLTDTLKQIWKDDPCRGDFALFGLGVGV